MSFGSVSPHHHSGNRRSGRDHHGPASPVGGRRVLALSGGFALSGGLALSGLFALMLGAAGIATGAEVDRPIVLEVVHLEERLAFQASCDVTDGLGTTRTSRFAGQTNSSVRFVGTGVACRLHSSDAGLFQATLRNAGTVLARARGGASDDVMIAAR